MMVRFNQLTSEGKEFAFSTEEQAIGMAAFLLDQPQFEDISHFEIKNCASRLSVFFKLKPVPKTDKQFVFIDNDMMHTINLQMMRKVAQDMADGQANMNTED
jgi:hypothetical protein